MFVKENIKSFKNIFLVEMKILKLLNYLMDVWIILALIESSCVSFFLVKLKLRVFYKFFFDETRTFKISKNLQNIVIHQRIWGIACTTLKMVIFSICKSNYIFHIFHIIMDFYGH
jgi:hypothetical protein